MRELWLLRHAKSDWRVPVKDFERPLRKRGVKAISRMGNWAKNTLPRPGRIISSPAKRARQTASLFAKSLGFPEQGIEFEPLLYFGDQDDMVTWLQGLKGAEPTLVVGHNPDLEDLLCDLCKISPERGEDGKLLPTATLAIVRFRDKIVPSGGTLTRLQRPKTLP